MRQPFSQLYISLLSCIFFLFQVFFPKDYVPGSADYDFSLLRLDRPMPIGRNIAVLNLPSKDYVMKEEDILIVTGWGSTDVSLTFEDFEGSGLELLRE